MTNPSAGDTVKTRKTKGTAAAEEVVVVAGSEGTSRGGQFGGYAVCGRKRRRECSYLAAVPPEKTQRRDEHPSPCSVLFACHRDIETRDARRKEQEEEVEEVEPQDDAREQPAVTSHETSARWYAKKRKQETGGGTQPDRHGKNSKRDELARMRKTIQWLEEGARRLREDLANARTELHEERRAMKIVRRQMDSATREARASEAAKYQLVISELKSRLASRSSSVESASVAASCASSTSSLKADLAREENQKREALAMKKRLGEAEKTIRRLTWESSNAGKNRAKSGSLGPTELRRLETEIRSLRAANEKLEEKLRIAVNAEKTRTNELRIQHENHEAELSTLRKSFRSETIKMMDELRGKSREIERLSKQIESVTHDSRKRRKTASASVEDVPTQKFRESGRVCGAIRSMGRQERKILAEDGRMTDPYILEVGCEKEITNVEVERLRELALEQQEIIEILRQAVKERERKLEQLSNKRRKEEFYRQWLELEPVAEVEDEDEQEHEEGDSALSSAPSSLSPQPGGCAHCPLGNGVTREAYEAVLVEIEDLQTKLTNERQELSRARTHLRDLEKTLNDEARWAARNAESKALNEKLREAEEREASLLAELSELREQNELLEFRLLELEESTARRESPEHAADSGIVSPEPVHLQKDQSDKPRSRAVATVIPYTSNNRPISPVPQKPPLSLQESGIFEQEDDDADNDEEDGALEIGIELASCGTQTEVPAGELLQEVQRLQELRARLQERVSKTASPSGPVNPAVCSVEAQLVDPIAQLSNYQERVRELEERLEAYEEAEESRSKEKLLSKFREEELLDENYRLTERIYWLENELRNLEEILSKREVSSERADKSTTTESVDCTDGSTQITNDACQTEMASKDTANFAQQCTFVDGRSCVTVEDRSANLLMSGVVEEVAKEAMEREDDREESNEEVEEKGAEARRRPTAVNIFESPDSEKKVIYFRWR